MNTVRFCYAVAAAAFMSLAVSSFDASMAEQTAVVAANGVSAPVTVNRML